MFEEPIGDLLLGDRFVFADDSDQNVFVVFGFNDDGGVQVRPDKPFEIYRPDVLVERMTATDPAGDIKGA